MVGHLTDASVPEFDFHFATVYLLDGARPDETMVVRKAAGAATTAAIEASETGAGRHAAKRGCRAGCSRRSRPLAPDDVLVYVARTWQAAVVGPLEPSGTGASQRRGQRPASCGAGDVG